MNLKTQLDDPFVRTFLRTEFPSPLGSAQGRVDGFRVTITKLKRT